MQFFLKPASWLILFFFFTIANAFGQIRYVDDLPGNIVKEDFEYVTLPLKSCWNEGNKPNSNANLIRRGDPLLYNPSNIAPKVPGSTINNKCFNYFEFSSLKKNYDVNDTTVTLNYRVYSLENDHTPNRRSVIYIYGGGGFFDWPVIGGGLRFWDTLAYNPQYDKLSRKQDEFICNYFARKGFVVFAVDTRKGWDMKGISNLNKQAGFQNYWFHKNCDCEGTCDAYTYDDAIYRMMQDVRTAHSYIMDRAGIHGIDPNAISYAGSSGGAFISIMLGFSQDDFPAVTTIGSNSQFMTLEAKHGPLDRYISPNINHGDIRIQNIYAMAGAIIDTNWVELEDSIRFVNNAKFPVLLIQGTIDSLFGYCSSYMTNVEYQNETNEIFKCYGCGAIHDRILHLSSNTISHLVTMKGFKHSMLFNNADVSCFNDSLASGCFNTLPTLEEYDVKTDIVFRFATEPNQDFYHVIYYADTSINQGTCNFCDFKKVAMIGQNSPYRFSACTINIDSAIMHADEVVTGYNQGISIETKNYKIYPNMTTGKFILERNNNESEKWSIYDLTGRLQITGNITKDVLREYLDISQLQHGLYIFNVYDGNKNLFSAKLIKQ